MPQARPLLCPVSNSVFTHLFQCPACGNAHGINTEPGRYHAVWQISGTPEAPTVRASVLVRSSRPIPGSPDNELTVCHLFITNGMIEYLGDCTHELAGQTVPMEPL